MYTRIIFAVAFIIILNTGCKYENHIDKYQVKLSALITLPDNFYAYRRGSIYSEDIKLEKYRIWYNLNDNGNVKDIFKIDDFSNWESNLESVIEKYAIDTNLSKKYAQAFVNMSRKYKFGHLDIDKKNKVVFSYKEGLFDQYVFTFNDSTKQVYSKNKDFKLLKNGWFERISKEDKALIRMK